MTPEQPPKNQVTVQILPKGIVLLGKQIPNTTKAHVTAK
jgi:hypothetical protein